MWYEIIYFPRSQDYDILRFNVEMSTYHVDYWQDLLGKIIHRAPDITSYLPHTTCHISAVTEAIHQTGMGTASLETPRNH